MARRVTSWAVLLAFAIGCPTGDPPADDDTTAGDDDTSAGDDDTTVGDDDTGPDHVLLEAPLGLAFAFNEWAGQDFATHLDALGLRRIHVTVWWGDFEPSPDDYRHALVDDFVDQLGETDLGTIRITARGNPWGMTEESDFTVPADMAVGGDYYEFVHEVVTRSDGRVALFQNDWEVDQTINWHGTPAQYAEMTRTFHAAVSDADPAATVVLGGSYAALDTVGEEFFDAVFADLAADDQELPFDLFDLHLYQPAHRYPELIASMRAVLDAREETAGTPIVALEFGGPTPQEYRDEYPELYDQLISEFHDDITLLGSDLSSTPLQPDGYPDELRMFAYGSESELDDRRDRIQARGMARRAVVALAEGVSALHWWELMAQQVELSVDLGVYFRHFTYGKLNLTLPDPDPGGAILVPEPTYDAFQRVAGWLDGVDSVVREDVGDPDLWLFRLDVPPEQVGYVLWHHRDAFHGEDQPPVSVTFPVPWQAVAAEDVFGQVPDAAVDTGAVTLEVTGTPVHITAPRH